MNRYYGYHSFPRRDASLSTAHAVLVSIIRCGLVLAPEVTEWSETLEDGSRSAPIMLAQKRCCFTVIPQVELPEHAVRFGPYALEFEIDSLRRIGAVPVAYLPMTQGSPAGASALGETFLARLADIQALLEVLATHERPQDRVSSLGVAGSPAALRDALRAFSGLIYPANRSDDDLVEYFRQHEWRVVANVVNHGRALSEPLSRVCRSQVLGIDEEFWTRPLPLPSGTTARVDAAHVLREVDGLHVLRYARALVVPPEAVETASKALSDAGFELSVRELPEV